MDDHEVSEGISNVPDVKFSLAWESFEKHFFVSCFKGSFKNLFHHKFPALCRTQFTFFSEHFFRSDERKNRLNSEKTFKRFYRVFRKGPGSNPGAIGTFGDSAVPEK